MSRSLDHLLAIAFNNNTMAGSSTLPSITTDSDAESALYRWCVDWWNANGTEVFTEELQKHTGTQFCGKFNNGSISAKMRKAYNDVKGAKKRKTSPTSTAVALTSKACGGGNLKSTGDDEDGKSSSCCLCF